MYTPKAYNEGFLPEVDGHKIYYAEYGNPDGEVIVTLHGGPGSQSKPKYAARLDNEKYRVVVFDQRGCGKSEPRGNVEQNTTQDLVADMERLREQLGVERWFVSGSSWGSTLALAYAEMHPDRVKGLLLSAVWLSDPGSLDWFNKTPNGAGMVFPDLWAKRMADLENLGVDPQSAAAGLYEKLRLGTDDEKQQAAAIFANWEANLLTALRETHFVRPEEIDEHDLHDATIFMHFEVNDFFLKPEQIMQQVAAIKNIPTIIVHGRHDMICPYEQAWKLHQALPESTLVTAPQSNHQFTPDGEVARYYAFDSFLQEHAGK